MQISSHVSLPLAVVFSKGNIAPVAPSAQTASCIMDELRARILHGNSALTWYEGILGLTLKLDFLEACGASAELLRQWKEGRSLGVDNQPVPKRARNHPSVDMHANWAEREWTRLEDAGKVEFFPLGARPAELNVNPCGLILKQREGIQEDATEEQKYKARLIVDLRRGRVNAHLPEIGVSYGTLEQAISRMRRNSWLFVVDLQDCFFNWRVAPADTMMLGFFSPARKQFGKYNYLPFGLKPAPGINDQSVKEIMRLLLLHKRVNLLDFVDDLLGANEHERQAWSDLNTTVDFLLSCGIPVSSKPSGVRAPSTTQTWIGWVFDTTRAVVTTSQEKCDKCCAACLAALQADSSRTLRSRLLASAAGRASHLAELLPQARRMLHPIWADLNAAGVYAAWQSGSSADPPVSLSENSRRALSWLVSTFATPPVRQLFCEGGDLSSWGHKSPEFAHWEALAEQGLVKVVETDASKTHGWSYHMCADSRIVSGEWPADFASTEGHASAADINYKELWVACECLRREASVLAGWRVVFRMDNTPAIHYVNVRYGRVPHLERLAAKLEEAEQRARCWALAVHLPGRSNVIADAGSRDSSFAAEWASDRFKDAVLKPALFADVQARCGVHFTVDLFADRTGQAALAPLWRFPERTAFEFDLSGHVVWAHPPRGLAKACLEHFARVRQQSPDARIVLLLPEDRGAPWFRAGLLSSWFRIRTWEAGSDIFRWVSPSGALTRGPRSDLAYSVLQSWRPKRRKTTPLSTALASCACTSYAAMFGPVNSMHLAELVYLYCKAGVRRDAKRHHSRLLSRHVLRLICCHVGSCQQHAPCRVGISGLRRGHSRIPPHVSAQVSVSVPLLSHKSFLPAISPWTRSA